MSALYAESLVDRWIYALFHHMEYRAASSGLCNCVVDHSSYFHFVPSELRAIGEKKSASASDVNGKTLSSFRRPSHAS